MDHLHQSTETEVRISCCISKRSGCHAVSKEIMSEILQSEEYQLWLSGQVVKARLNGMSVSIGLSSCQLLCSDDAMAVVHVGTNSDKIVYSSVKDLTQQVREVVNRSPQEWEAANRLDFANDDELNDWIDQRRAESQQHLNEWLSE